jgi:hypothetical protein
MQLDQKHTMQLDQKHTMQLDQKHTMQLDQKHTMQLDQKHTIQLDQKHTMQLSNISERLISFNTNGDVSLFKGDVFKHDAISTKNMIKNFGNCFIYPNPNPKGFHF